MLTLRAEEQLELSTPERTSFQNGLRWSFGIHIGILVVLMFKAAFFPSDLPNIPSAIQVDMVGLPDKMDPKKLATVGKTQKKELPTKNPEPQPTAAKPVAEVKPEPKVENKPEPDTIALKKAPAKDETKTKQQDAFAKLKTISAIDKIKNDVQDEQKKKIAGLSGQIIKGNVVNPGNALSGLDKLQHDSYVTDVEAHAKSHWSVPEWLARKKLVTTVRVKIDRQGNLIHRELLKASGNISYDEAVFTVIDRASPFPKPPEKFIQWMAVNGVVIEFGSDTL